MVQRLRHRAQGQEGFTLIELLVVILIIGILAAVAIPVFLNQTGKANDANVKSDINSAAVAEETYFTDNQNYISAGPAGGSNAITPLTNINPALTNAFNLYTATSNPGDSLTVNAQTAAGANATTGPGYSITGTDPSGITFTYTKAAAGTVTRSCSVPASVNVGGCKGAVAGGAAGSW